MISIEHAREIVSSHISPLPPRTAELSASLGHVLAQNVLADADYPSADRSMMDGYVIRTDAAPGTFRVTAEIPAGIVPTTPLGVGESMRIFTGAILPPGGGRIVMQEDCARSADTVAIPSFSENLFIRPQGAEAQNGAIVLPAGILIGAPEMAILAQVGYTSPQVIPHPSIRHLATGDELVPPSQTPPPGHIRDTNSSLLAGLIPGLISTHAPDDPATMKSLFEGNQDLLLISGGASVGDHDHGSSTLRALGYTIHFDKVNLRPGKPLTFATRGTQVAFVIPGNPVSHFVCYHLAIRLAIDLLSGIHSPWHFLDLEIIGKETLRPNPRETFWPAEVSIQNGKLIATPKPWSSSGDTFSLTRTNALIRVGEATPITLLLNIPHSNPV
ncbi:MAG: molybdopterin molybdotransferase MoeA [Akkermansiaceae bacterium]|nr:molybdopterin molybdotransferase MoeA [Akkermansiaceae bacterium]